MRKIISFVIAFVLALSFSGCKNNVAQKLTVYNATFTMGVRYEFADSDLSGTICFPRTQEFFANTCAQIVMSDHLLNQVAEEPGINLTASQIRAMLSFEVLEDGSVVKIIVTSNDSPMALYLAQAIAQIAPDVISSFIEGIGVWIIDNPKVTKEISLRNLFR